MWDEKFQKVQCDTPTIKHKRVSPSEKKLSTKRRRIFVWISYANTLSFFMLHFFSISFFTSQSLFGNFDRWYSSYKKLFRQVDKTYGNESEKEWNQVGNVMQNKLLPFTNMKPQSFLQLLRVPINEWSNVNEGCLLLIKIGHVIYTTSFWCNHDCPLDLYVGPC